MPLDTTLLYCDHGWPVGGDCWRCWQRRALDAEADLDIQITRTEQARNESDALRADLRAVAEAAENLLVGGRLYGAERYRAELRAVLKQPGVRAVLSNE